MSNDSVHRSLELGNTHAHTHKQTYTRTCTLTHIHTHTHMRTPAIRHTCKKARSYRLVTLSLNSSSQIAFESTWSTPPVIALPCLSSMHWTPLKAAIHNEGTTVLPRQRASHRRNMSQTRYLTKTGHVVIVGIS